MAAIQGDEWKCREYSRYFSITSGSICPAPLSLTQNFVIDAQKKIQILFEDKGAGRRPQAK